MACDAESILLGHPSETKVLGDGYNIDVDNIENKTDQELKCHSSSPERKFYN